MKEMRISELMRLELSDEVGLLDLDALMDSTISMAAARVVEPWTDDNQARMTKRIDIFRDAYKHRPFRHITWQRVVDLVARQEDLTPEPEKWLTKMATYNKHLREGATFQTAVWKHLQEVISPCLSLILSIIDPHNNLDHMLRPDLPRHRELFLELYRLCDISHNSLFTPAQEFTVLRFSDEKFISRIPFSWMICLEEDNYSRFTSSYHQQPLTDIRSIIGRFEEMESFQDDYIHDLLMQKLPGGERVVEILKSVVEQSLGKQEDGTMSLVARIHVSFNQCKQELVAFHALVMKDPAIMDRIDPLNLPDRVDRFVLGEYLDRRFVPKFEGVGTQGLEVWSSAFYSVHPIVIQILDQPTESEELIDLKKKWDQIHIFHVFLRHIYAKNLGEILLRTISGNLKLLWRAVKAPDFESEKTFKGLVSALTRMNKDAAKCLNLGGIKCVRCEESPSNPVLLECQHVGCEKCLQEYLQACQEQGKAKRCPDPKCEKPEISEDFSVRSTQVLKDAKMVHDLFRVELSMFFMDCLDLFYFKDNAKPSDLIVNTLLELVIIKKDVADRRREKTKDISPFPEHAIDPAPVVRSFILKLCLKSDAVQSRDCIQKILMENSRVLSEEDIVELSRLYIYTREDMITQRELSKKADAGSGDTLRIGRAIQAFEDNDGINDVDIDTFLDVDFLEFVANQRFGHQNLARALLITLDPSNPKDLVDISNELINTAVGCHRAGTNLETFKKYLVKELYSRRADSIGELRKRKQLQALFPAELWNTPEIVERDLYLMYSDNYKDARNQLIALFTSKDLDHFRAYLDNNKDPEQFALLILSLQFCTEVNFFEEPSQEVINSLRTILEGMSAEGEGKIVEISLLAQSNLLARRRPRRTIELEKLALLAMVKLRSVNGGLQQVFKYLVFFPERLVDKFVPTVEHDVQYETVSRLDGRLMSCPNGHVYSILDCGRPTTESKCPDCKKAIGGLNYQEHTGNRTLNRPTADNSRRGVTVIDLRPNVEGVRELSSLDLNMIRALMNICLLAGTTLDQARVGRLLTIQKANDLIKATNNLINIIAGKLGRSEDDVLLLMAMMIQGFPDMGSDVCNLTDLVGRQAWEKNFSQKLR